MKKMEIKAGRQVSVIGIMMGIMGTVFGIFWIGMVLHLSRPWDDGIEPGVVFLLVFGVMFIIVIMVITAFYVRNTFAKKRPSLLDIEEETDDEINASGSTENRTTPDGEINFCTYCGGKVKKEFSYCQTCGKKIVT
ncbi:MAG: hypothetical protein C0399_04090 [Syntrophus sp. (in: bacteria)]|nr:hypothetical protein [Syntrophus sp. (in: bacteria)]